VVLQLKRWAFRRHNNKSKRWTLDKYFKSEGSRNWIFRQTVKEKGKKTKQSFTLNKLADIPINRYLKIKKEANPFDPAWNVYFEERRDNRLKVLRAGLKKEGMTLSDWTRKCHCAGLIWS
jgi:RNA-directed DNA polymerase